MKKDFLTYRPDNVHELVFELPGDDDIKDMCDDAKNLESFIRFEVKEMGPLYRVDHGIRFRITVMLRQEPDATWYRLKWA
jgi:hypothetical protein